MKHRPPLRLLLAAGAGTAAALLIPAAAFADAQVTATSAAPGEMTTITVGCGADATSASISGTSFGGPSEIPLQTDTAGGPGAFSGTVTIPAATSPGTYTLSATCSTGEGGTGSLVVTPTGAPQSGGGAASSGVNAIGLATGAGLILAAGGAGYAALRRRKASME